MPVEVGQPTELDPWVCYSRVRDALHAGTTLRVMDDDLVGTRTAPSQITHRRFRLDPRARAFFGKPRPGDVVMVREQVAVLLSHDLQERAAEASYRLASTDFVTALRALTSRHELSAIGAEVMPGSVVLRRTAARIEQELVVQVQYEISLPGVT